MSKYDDADETEVSEALLDIKKAKQKGRRSPTELVYDPDTGTLYPVEEGEEPDPDTIVATNMAKEGFF